ncbi:uncharacterized protein LOC119076543 [Bradysia coprophila]|uniref:uncharacterized protein LOC119076543 n=1 Tax=Bradysia coprophila TaxID=38358 RepID=UPI00187DD88E|nr:uncharacterized protein LOC119076543 [Bradysia coprophila]
MKTSHRSSESDSSSDDENLQLLREAADTSLISDSMFKLAGKRSEESSSSKPPAALKSQRQITDANEHIDDLLVPEEMRKFVSKKLAKIIENSVEFVYVSETEESPSRADDTVEEIKLLDNVVLNIDWAGETAECNKRKKQDIRKRKLPDVDDSKTESVRISEAVVDLEDLSMEVSNWQTRPKGTVFEYHEKNGKLFEVEPETEFSEKRKRNNWNESRISMRNTNRSQ